MAIGEGKFVSPKIATFAPVVQGPLFGVVESGTEGVGPYVVLWANGERVEAVNEVTLDEILAANDVVANALVGRRVKVSNPSGQNNWAIGNCVGVYNRDGNAMALIQNTASGYFIEVLASLCTETP